MRRLISVAILILLLVQSAWGQVVTRGPYLQQQTDHSIIVRWRTDVATDSVVRFGTDSASLIQSSSNVDVTTEHTVLVSGLAAATQYYYSVGSSALTLAGDATYHFSTSPEAGVAADTRLWVLGDSGTANSNAFAVRDAFKTWSSSKPADFILMLGDNAYNNGTDSEYQNAVFDTYPALLRQLPLWSTLGNHDGYSADSATQTGPYYEIFDLPTNAEAGGLASYTEAYYSFDYGNIHFVVLDSYDTDRSTSGTMLTWLESDLAANDKPWLIAIWHHPPYTKGSHNSDSEGRLIDMRQNALPILEAWGVDLVMTGHSHTYERSFLLDGHYGLSDSLDVGANILDIGDGSETGDGAYQKPGIVAAQNEGAIYAVAGSSGKLSLGYSLDHPAMLVALESLGSMVVDVAGNRMDVTFLDQNALVQDEFSIVKTPDTDAPLITAASAEDATHVLVDYSERVSPASASDAANYSIAGLSVTAAELMAGNSGVRLTTSTMTAGSHYVLTVNNVMDESGNTIAGTTEAEYDYFVQVTRFFQDGLLPDTGYDGTFDTYIREASASTNYGSAATLQMDGDEPSGTATDMSIMLGWDVSAIPVDANVLSVTMHLNVLNISSGPYYCYGLLRAWDETQTTWNNAATGVAWASAGAQGASDRDSLPLCSLSAPSTGSLAVSLNADGIAMVQSWVDGSASNFGMVIADSATSDGADFDSSESANAMGRPKLEVVYSTPVDPVNLLPTAAFTSDCNDLDCSFSDASSDSDGSVVAWLWDFGDGTTSASPNPSHTYPAANDYTVTLTVTDNETATGQTSAVVSPSEPAQFVDYFASSQVAGAGTISGSYVDTHTNNGVSQAITERVSGGKKQSRYSYLEFKWVFNVGPATGFLLNLNAWKSGSADGDNFVFAFSTNDSNYTDVLTVSSTDPTGSQVAMLPGNLNGTVYIRVRDTNRSPGNTALDTIYVDHMYIHADSAPGTAPAAPSALAATAQSASSVGLSWTDNADDAQSFEVQVSDDEVSWTGAGNPGMNATSANVNGLAASTTYYFRVRAANLSGSSAWSNTASATTQVGPPPPDIELALSGSKNRGQHVVSLTWSGTTSENVEIYRDGSLMTATPDTGAYTDDTQNKGGRTYTYQVCEQGSAECSAVESITF